MSVKRQITVKMRLTKEEKELLEQRMRDADIQNREAYLRKMALTGYVLKLDLSEAREALRLMSNTTSNINQITKMANATRSIYGSDMIKIREEVSNMRSQASDIMKVFGKVRKFLDL